MKFAKKIAVLLIGATLTLGTVFGLTACGNSGDSLTPHIGENGNWFIGDSDTGVKAAGTDGKDGTNGSSFLHGAGKPEADLGNPGDLYLDLNTYDLYEKTASGWSADPVGNIKGADGGAGDTGNQGGVQNATVQGNVVKTWSNRTITANGQLELDVRNLAPGLYWLFAENVTGVTAADYNILTAEAATPTGKTDVSDTEKMTFDLYSPTAQGFRGLVLIDDTISTIAQPKILSTSSTPITATWKLVKYEPVAVNAGVEVEIPTGKTGGNVSALAAFTLDSSLLGKQVNITISTWLPGTSIVTFGYRATSQLGLSTIGSLPQKGDVFSGTTPSNLPTGDVEFGFTTATACNIVVKFKLAS